MTDEAVGPVIADGGPLDGQELFVAVRVDEITVTMADGTRHRYVKADPSPGGHGAMRWVGRV